MLPVAAELDFRRAGLPEPPPWKRDEDYQPPDPGYLRISGFVSKPELQKLNRNSIYVFVNHRLIRDRLILHALTEAYRNIIPPTSFPVVLLFLDMPPEEVDVNVHPAKTEVRFRQPAFVHDFLRDTVRTALIQARPAASFASALTGGPHDPASSLNIDVSPLPGEPTPDRPRRDPAPALHALNTYIPARSSPSTAPSISTEARSLEVERPPHFADIQPARPYAASPLPPRPAHQPSHGIDQPTYTPTRPPANLHRPLLRTRPQPRRHRSLHPPAPQQPPAPAASTSTPPTPPHRLRPHPSAPAPHQAPPT